MLFQAVKGVKTAGIHVVKAVFRFKIGKIGLKPLPGVGKPRRDGESRPGADEDGVGLVNRFPQAGAAGFRFNLYHFSPSRISR